MELQCLILPNFYSDDKKKTTKKKYTEKTEPKKKPKKKPGCLQGFLQLQILKGLYLHVIKKENQKLHSSKVSMRSKIKTAALISNGIADQINRLINLLIH